MKHHPYILRTNDGFTISEHSFAVEATAIAMEADLSRTGREVYRARWHGFSLGQRVRGPGTISTVAVICGLWGDDAWLSTGTRTLTMSIADLATWP